MSDAKAAFVKSLAVPTVAALVAMSILLSLGFWQVARLDWKRELIAQVEARSRAEPVPLTPASTWPAEAVTEGEYRRVRIEGRFRHEAEAYLYTAVGDSRRPGDPTRASGPGYFVLTPLALTSGGTVIVNRGFVPENRRDPATRAAGQIGGEVTVVGLIRFSEPRGFFAAPDDIRRRLFYTRDVGLIAATMALSGPVAPFIVDADATPVPGGLPQGGETRLVFTNRHFEYALTWFGLALTLLGVFGAFVIQKFREPVDNGAGAIR